VEDVRVALYAEDGDPTFDGCPHHCMRDKRL